MRLGFEEPFAWPLGLRQPNKDISWMHVGMNEIVDLKNNGVSESHNITKEKAHNAIISDDATSKCYVDCVHQHDKDIAKMHVSIDDAIS